MLLSGSLLELWSYWVLLVVWWFLWWVHDYYCCHQSYSPAKSIFVVVNMSRVINDAWVSHGEVMNGALLLMLNIDALKICMLWSLLLLVDNQYVVDQFLWWWTSSLFTHMLLMNVYTTCGVVIQEIDITLLLEECGCSYMWRENDDLDDWGQGDKLLTNLYCIILSFWYNFLVMLRSIAYFVTCWWYWRD